MGDQQPPPPTRSRRRVLSCKNCRRLKSRCEYSGRINSCQRCYNLRIQCSLQSDATVPRAPAGGDGQAQDTTVNDRISHLESSLASVKESTDKILLFLQQSASRSLRSLDEVPIRHTGSIADTVSGSHLTEQPETTDFPPLHRARNDDNKSAPIMTVRKFRSSRRRLYEDPRNDIISRGILSETVAERLVSEFILRLGHVIQVKTLDDLTSASSLRQASPLLYAVCCLQALRFFKEADWVNTNLHRELYEEVRGMLGQVVLATPIPVEELYAMLIMCLFEAAPRPVFEYIESWHLSGICAQQAISTIDFVEVMANLSMGKHEASDKRYLSLWNNICLVHLRFAVGTGKPATIPPDLLDQCPAILNHPQATIDDGMVLAEILLFSALCNKHKPPVLDRHGHCAELTAWETRWEHLLQSEKAAHLRFGREFAYLVLVMRLVEKCRSSGSAQSTFQADQVSGYETPLGTGDDSKIGTEHTTNSFEARAYTHALAIGRIFLEMPAALVQELPKFHHICLTYCCIVLSECTEAFGSMYVEVSQTLSHVYARYRQFSDGFPTAMTAALEKTRRRLGGETSFQPSIQDSRSYPATNYPSGDGTNVSDYDDNATTALADTRGFATGAAGGNAIDPEQGLNSNFFDYELGLLSFPTVGDFFGSWTMDTGVE